MNAAYATQQSSPPLHYRDGPPTHGHYSVQHSMNMPQQAQQQPPQSQVAGFTDYGGHGLAPLAPGNPPAAAEPMPKSCIENGRKYELRVIQQPKRARMCGFGDKDRRPITPPPCVRLIITDATTGKEIDCNEIDHGMFVLNVDLWSPEGTRPVNLVRHAPTSPSIGGAITVSTFEGSPYNAGNVIDQHDQGDVKHKSGPSPYTPYSGGPAPNPYAQQNQQPPYSSGSQYNSGYAPTTNGSQQYPQNGFNQSQSYYTAGGAPPPGNAPQPGSEYANAPPSSQLTSYSGRPYQQAADQAPNRIPNISSQQQPTGMYTRNLIGSLSASAFRLTDPHDHIGIWFVLQDLSVRTEGQFRLRFSFVNVGVPPSPTNSEHNTAPSNPNQPLHIQFSSQVNKTKAPILAACFSDVFTVYSAKRFPGVVESTDLSKCFATQGIKIPIRKEGGGKGGRNDDGFDED